jgi:hypothetical protein
VELESSWLPYCTILVDPPLGYAAACCDSVYNHSFFHNLCLSYSYILATSVCGEEGCSKENVKYLLMLEPVHCWGREWNNEDSDYNITYSIMIESLEDQYCGIQYAYHTLCEIHCGFIMVHIEM